MDLTSRYKQTLAQIRARRPTYLLGYGGGMVLLLLAIAISVAQAWYSFVILALAGLAILVYFFVVNLWAYHTLYDDNWIRDTLYELGYLEPTMTLVDVNLGIREFPVALSRRLTTGKVIVLDVYNPLLAPSRVLVRRRGAAERPESDPRLSWRDGSVNLLPLPDNSVQVVTLVQILSELWQEGDRLKLLREAKRILRPGGCLLLAERVQTPINIAVAGPAGLRLSPVSYWHSLLERSDLKVGQSKSLRDLMLCVRADKRLANETRPLPVDP
ncbi:MAG: class I SAM-dependent methyltransferase [Chloroflexota bacterium]|jgi:SAM-dependent methyltransferase